MTVARLLATLLVLAWIANIGGTILGNQTGLYRLAIIARDANLVAIALSAGLWLWLMLR